MLSQRQRSVVWAVVLLAAIWAVATAGYLIVKGMKGTAERVAAYIDSVDLSKLSPEARARAIKELADKINALSMDERQRFRMERTGFRWFEQMTEEEKGNFVEATMPTGFKQMINAFEEMPEDRRRRAIEGALRGLRDTRQRLQDGGVELSGGTNRPPITPELEAKVRAIGLKAFYSQSSAQTKAELAPVLEELQRVMERGGRNRGR